MGRKQSEQSDRVRVTSKSIYSIDRTVCFLFVVGTLSCGQRESDAHTHRQTGPKRQEKKKRECNLWCK